MRWLIWRVGLPGSTSILLQEEYLRKKGYRYYVDEYGDLGRLMRERKGGNKTGVSV